MPDEMNAERLAEIAARAEAATKGPWWTRPDYGCDNACVYCNGDRPDVINGSPESTLIYDEGGHSEADAEFIAHAREDIPALIAEVERLREENENLKGQAEYLDREIEQRRHQIVCRNAENEGLKERLGEINKRNDIHLAMSIDKLKENDALRAQLETEILRRDSLDETLNNVVADHKKDLTKLAAIRKAAAPIPTALSAAVTILNEAFPEGHHEAPLNECFVAELEECRAVLANALKVDSLTDIRPTPVEMESE